MSTAVAPTKAAPLGSTTTAPPPSPGSISSPSSLCPRARWVRAVARSIVLARTVALTARNWAGALATNPNPISSLQGAHRTVVLSAGDWAGAPIRAATRRRPRRARAAAPPSQGHPRPVPAPRPSPIRGRHSLLLGRSTEKKKVPSPHARCSGLRQTLRRRRAPNSFDCPSCGYRTAADSPSSNPGAALPSLDPSTRALPLCCPPSSSFGRVLASPAPHDGHRAPQLLTRCRASCIRHDDDGAEAEDSESGSRGWRSCTPVGVPASLAQSNRHLPSSRHLPW